VEVLTANAPMNVPEKIGLIHHNLIERRSRCGLYPDLVYPRALYISGVY